MNKPTHTLERVLETNKSGAIRGGGEPIRGTFTEPPTVGEGFKFLSSPITEGAIGRLIYTSDVLDIFEDGFCTKSGSIYTLTKL